MPHATNFIVTYIPTTAIITDDSQPTVSDEQHEETLSLVQQRITYSRLLASGTGRLILSMPSIYTRQMRANRLQDRERLQSTRAAGFTDLGPFLVLRTIGQTTFLGSVWLISRGGPSVRGLCAASLGTMCILPGYLMRSVADVYLEEYERVAEEDESPLEATRALASVSEVASYCLLGYAVWPSR